MQTSKVVNPAKGCLCEKKMMNTQTFLSVEYKTEKMASVYLTAYIYSTA